MLTQSVIQKTISLDPTPQWKSLTEAVNSYRDDINYMIPDLKGRVYGGKQMHKKKPHIATKAAQRYTHTCVLKPFIPCCNHKKIY